MLLLAGCPTPPAPPRPVYPSGELLWSYATGDSVETTPTVVDGVVTFGSREDHVFVLDAASGKELWRFHVKQSVTSSPTVADEVVNFGTRTLDSNQKALSMPWMPPAERDANFTTSTGPSLSLRLWWTAWSTSVQMTATCTRSKFRNDVRPRLPNSLLRNNANEGTIPKSHPPTRQ